MKFFYIITIFFLFIFSYILLISLSLAKADDNGTQDIILNNNIEQLEKSYRRLKYFTEELNKEQKNLKNNDKYLEYYFENKLEMLNFENYQNLDNVKQEIKKNSEILQNQLFEINGNLNSTINTFDAKINEQKGFLDKNIGILRENLINSKKLLSYLNSFFFFTILVIFIIIVLLFISFFSLKKSILDIINQLQSEKNILKNEFRDELMKLTDNLNNEIVKSDNKLIELMEHFIILTNNQKEILSMSYGNDHSLVLKIADEITRINNNISMVNRQSKDVDLLTASMKRIIDNFKSNGYEIIDLLNKPYTEAMKVNATFKSDENSSGHQFIITRTIKPQVNFKGKMIQAAHVEVSINDAFKQI